MKVAELSGAMLDYWVGKALGASDNWRMGTDGRFSFEHMPSGVDVGFIPNECCAAIPQCELDFRPSERWDQAGPIIERERIYIEPAFNNADSLTHWDAGCYSRKGTPDHFAGEWAQGRGSSALEAAMRAYIASRFGDEVPDAPHPEG
jgi:hypothetical protein